VLDAVRVLRARAGRKEEKRTMTKEWRGGGAVETGCGCWVWAGCACVCGKRRRAL